MWCWRGGGQVPLAGSVVARFLGESSANLRGRPRWGVQVAPHLLGSPSTWLYCPRGTPPPLGQHVSVGLVTQSRTHWVGREPSTAGSRVRLIGEAIGYGVGRGRGQAGILGLPPPSLLCWRSQLQKPCPPAASPAAAALPQPVRGSLWLGLAGLGAGPGEVSAPPPEDPRIMLEAHRRA